MMDKPLSFYAFEMLYWCGIREGELLALTPADFDFEKKMHRVNHKILSAPDMGKDVDHHAENEEKQPRHPDAALPLQMRCRTISSSSMALEPDMTGCSRCTKNYLQAWDGVQRCKGSRCQTSFRIHDIETQRTFRCLSTWAIPQRCHRATGWDTKAWTSPIGTRTCFHTVQKEMADKLNVERSN